MNTVRLLTGDCRALLAALPPASVHCVVTSPPYFGLRDYGVDGQIGLEPSPDAYVAELVAVFREVRRVLHPTGTVWLNLGDSYAASEGQCKTTDAAGPKQMTNGGSMGAPSRTGDVPAGNMLGIPWRVAFALQADGWLLRSDIIGAKVAPMPESVSGPRWERCRVKVSTRVENGRKARDGLARDGYDYHPHGGVVVAPNATWEDCPGCVKCAPNDGLVLRWGMWRPTSSHEHVFLLAKGPGYYADQEAVREPALRQASGNAERLVAAEGDRARTNTHLGSSVPWTNDGTGRNPRDVWEWRPEPYAEAHFAVMPERLAQWCIRAGTSERGVCAECGAPWVRVVEQVPTGAFHPAPKGWAMGPGSHTAIPGLAIHPNGRGNDALPAPVTRTETTGWRSSCAHTGEPVPATVLDPFSGAGTTALAAARLGRDAIGCDLNAEYHAMAEARIRGELGSMFTNIERTTA